MTHTFCDLFLATSQCCIEPIFGPFYQNVVKKSYLMCCVAHFYCVAKMSMLTKLKYQSRKFCLCSRVSWICFVCLNPNIILQVSVMNMLQRQMEKVLNKEAVISFMLMEVFLPGLLFLTLYTQSISNLSVSFGRISSSIKFANNFIKVMHQWKNNFAYWISSDVLWICLACRWHLGYYHVFFLLAGFNHLASPLDWILLQHASQDFNTCKLVDNPYQQKTTHQWFICAKMEWLSWLQDWSIVIQHSWELIHDIYLVWKRTFWICIYIWLEVSDEEQRRTPIIFQQW